MFAIITTVCLDTAAVIHVATTVAGSGQRRDKCLCRLDQVAQLGANTAEEPFAGKRDHTKDTTQDITDGTAGDSSGNASKQCTDPFTWIDQSADDSAKDRTTNSGEESPNGAAYNSTGNRINQATQSEARNDTGLQF